MSFSAPGESRIVAESTLLTTLNAILVGKLVLIRPVMTSTEGLWVARMTWIPAARPFCARRIIEAEILLAWALASPLTPPVMVRSAYSSMMMTM